MVAFYLLRWLSFRTFTSFFCVFWTINLKNELNTSLTSICSGQEQDLIETKAVEVGVGEKVGGQRGITLLGDVQNVGSEGGEAD